MMDMAQFVKAPIELIMDANLRDRDIRIYLALRSYRKERERGDVWPSRATIARRIRCSTDSIDRSITRLVNEGYISYIKGRKGRANIYQFSDRDGRSGAAILPADQRLDTSSLNEEVAAAVRHQSESVNQKYKPEKALRLFHGKDICSVADDGSIRIKVSRNLWVDWSGHDAGIFSFGEFRGEEARKEAIRRYATSSSLNQFKSDTVDSLPTNGEDSNSSRSQRPPFDNLNND